MSTERPAQRLLALMRHGTADPWAATDRQRPLAERGAQESRAAADWLAGTGFSPDHVLVSDAARTAATAREALVAWDRTPLWDQNPAVYEASPEALLDLVRTVPVDTGHLLVVGHNPTMAQLSQVLDSGEGLRVDPRDAFVPASLRIFRVDSAWLELSMFTAPVVGARSGDA